MLGGGGDALVEEGHVVGVGGVGGGAEFGEVGEGVREAEVVERDALVAFDEALEQRAQVDVGFCGLAHAGADRVERFEKVGGEGVFEVGWEAAAGEFLLDGGGDLFAEAGEFRGDGEEHFDEFFLAQDRMADQGVGEADEAAAALFDEVGVCCEMAAIDCDSFGR